MKTIVTPDRVQSELEDLFLRSEVEDLKGTETRGGASEQEGGMGGASV